MLYDLLNSALSGTHYKIHIRMVGGECKLFGKHVEGTGGSLISVVVLVVAWRD